MVEPLFLGRTGTAMDDLLNDFLAETAEILAEAGGAIVAWEADPADRAQLDAIFRFVHTIKGSSGFLALPRVTALSHAAEDALDQVRRGNRAANAALVTGVLGVRSEEHTSELQSLMRISYAVFCLKKKKNTEIR